MFKCTRKEEGRRERRIEDGGRRRRTEDGGGRMKDGAGGKWRAVLRNSVEIKGIRKKARKKEEKEKK